MSEERLRGERDRAIRTTSRLAFDVAERDNMIVEYKAEVERLRALHAETLGHFREAPPSQRQRRRGHEMTGTLLFESMLRIETDKYVCRIWRQHGESGIGLLALKYLAKELLQKDGNLKDMATALAQHERVNSVEIIFRAGGDGICVHVDWP